MAVPSKLLNTTFLRPIAFNYTRAILPTRYPSFQRRHQSTASTEDSEGIAEGTTGTSKTIRYTSESYPSLIRDPKYAQLTSAHIQEFKKIIGKDSAVIDGVTKDAEDDIEPFNGDWMRKYRGHTRLVLKPGSTEEVSKILRYCNENMIAVVPQGGNSGLVGGSVPVFDEIVMNMARMTNIRSFDDISGTLVVDAGCILEVVDHYLRSKDHIFPLDLGAKGSCQVGGNIATNAGGLRLLRYGSLHGNVLGLEVVLPDGTIISDLCKLRKNNTGYDLKQLFIGAEGTLGIVTSISIICPQKPHATNVAFVGVPSYAHAQRAFKEAKIQLSEILAAFELMDAESQRLVRAVTGKKYPLEGPHPFYCLIETAGSNAEHDSAKLEKFFEFVLEEGVVEDGVVAQDETQASELWSWREGITECLSHGGGVYKYDLSIPLPELYTLVEDTRSRMIEAGLLAASPAEDDAGKYPVKAVVGYGHMGDSNLHLNIATSGFDKRVEEALEPWVYEWVQRSGGSVSAEHGLGLAKKRFVGYSRDEATVGLMRRIRGLFDPHGIMNPYKYI